jgi:hypothetical protein
MNREEPLDIDEVPYRAVEFNSLASIRSLAFHIMTVIDTVTELTQLSTSQSETLTILGLQLESSG